MSVTESEIYRPVNLNKPLKSTKRYANEVKGDSGVVLKTYVKSHREAAVSNRSIQRGQPPQ